MEKIEYETMFSVENDFWWYRGLHDLVLRFVRPAALLRQARKKCFEYSMPAAAPAE
jgi:hypothetical protein